MDFKAGQKVHFVGIGGVSMSALAHSLASRGLQVSGSDRDEGERVAGLRVAGIKVAIGQSADNVGDADAYVYTTAIREDNPELVAARATGRPVLHRSEVLAELLQRHRAIAITGTHGKSTTTAMLGAVYLKLGLDPTVFVGADVPDLGGTHHIGDSDLFIFEACESDGSFLRYRGCSQVLTSVEPDHLDEHGTFERLQQAYADFLASADPDGFLVYRADDPIATRLAQDSPATPISFGLAGEAQVMARDIAPLDESVAYECIVEGQSLGRVQLQVPGRCNVANALAATAACLGAGLEAKQVCAALAQFRGVDRRFERLGQLNGAVVYDDYAHHPTEVRAAIQALQEHFDRSLLVIFQPHLYSRTRDFMDDFAAAFDEADTVIIADIYPAREQPIPGVNSARLAELIASRRPQGSVHYFPEHEEIVDFVARQSQPGQLIMTIGAGDIREVGERLAALGEREEAGS